MGLSIPILATVPIMNFTINERQATALVDTGTSFNISFVRGLGITMTPHVIEVQKVDNCCVKTAAMVSLHLEGCGLGGIYPSPRSMALEALSMKLSLGAMCWAPGVLLVVFRARLLGPRESLRKDTSRVKAVITSCCIQSDSRMQSFGGMKWLPTKPR